MTTSFNIDPRLLVSWSTGSSYTIRITENLVTEDGGSYSPSPQLTSTFVTPVSGPYVSSVFPTYGSSGGEVNAKLTYTVPTFVTTGSVYSFHLYKSTGNVLIADIPSTSTRVTVNVNTASINLRSLMQPGSSYYITADAGVYYDMFNFGSVPIVNDTVFKYTPTSATLVTVVPTFNTSSATNTVKLTYDRPLFERTTGTYHLYEYDVYSPTNPFIISTLSNRISFTGTTATIDVSGLTVPGGTYWIMSDYDCLRDQLDFIIPQIDNPAYPTTATIIKWSPIGASITATFPTNGQSNIFTTNATFTYNRNITKNVSGYVHTYNDVPLTTATNYYLNFQGTDYSTLTSIVSYYPTTGSKISIDNDNKTVRIDFGDVNLKEGTYYITADAGGVKDNLGLPVQAITSSTLSWYNTVISNMTTRPYIVNSSTSIFANNTPIVLDSQDGNFIFSLTSVYGTFNSSIGGVMTGNTWTYIGTQTALNAILPTIQFYSNVTSTSVNSYSYSLTRSNFNLVNKTLPLLGSMQSNSIPISISTNTGETYQGEAFTIGLSSTSSFSLSGTTATIYVDGIALPKVTFSGNTASISTIINSTGSAVGSHDISVTYNGGSIPGGWTVPTFVAATARQNITWRTIPSITLTANSSTYSTLQSRTMSMTLNTSTTINSSTSITLEDTRTYPIYSTLTTFLNTTTSISILEIGMTPISGVSPSNGVSNTAAPGSSWGYPNRWYYIRVSDSTGLTVGNTINLQAYGNYKVGGTGPTINWNANSHYPITRIINTGTNAYLVLGLYLESGNAVYTDDAISGYAYNQSSPNTGGASISGAIPLSSVITSTSTFISGYNTTTNVYTATVINNTATFTIPANTGTGIHSSIGLWTGTRNVPYYFPAYTTTASYLVVPPSTATISVSLSTGTYYYYSDQFGTVNTSSITATITVSNVGGVYSGRAPTGKVTIRDVVSGVISTATLTTGTMTNSIVNIGWAPPSKGQSLDTIRNLTVTYEGDIWNSSSTNTSTTFSIIKPAPVFTISLASTGTLAYQTVAKDTYGHDGEIGFMATVPHQYPVTLKITKPAGVSYTGDIHVLNNNFGDVRLTGSYWSGNTATVTTTIMSTGATSQILYTDQFHITYAGDSIHSNGDGGAGYADFYCYNTTTSQTELAYTYQTAFAGTVGYFGPATLYIKGT